MGYCDILTRVTKNLWVMAKIMWQLFLDPTCQGCHVITLFFKVLVTSPTLNMQFEVIGRWPRCRTLLGRILQTFKNKAL